MKTKTCVTLTGLFFLSAVFYSSPLFAKIDGGAPADPKLEVLDEQFADDNTEVGNGENTEDDWNFDNPAPLEDEDDFADIANQAFPGVVAPAEENNQEDSDSLAQSWLSTELDNGPQGPFSVGFPATQLTSACDTPDCLGGTPPAGGGNTGPQPGDDPHDIPDVDEDGFGEDLDSVSDQLQSIVVIS